MKKCSIYVVVIYTIAIMTVVGIFALIRTRWIDTNASFNGLSEYYSEITIGYDRELIELNQYTIIDLVQFMKEEETSFQIQKKTHSDYVLLYLHNMALDLNIVEGRGFIADDFAYKRNVALVSENYRSRVYEDEGKYFINIEGNTYEVIGIFSTVENTINSNANIILNLFSENYINSNDDIAGTYYVDTKKDNSELLYQLDRWCYIIDNGSVFTANNAERYQLMKDSLVLPIYVFYLLCLFMIVCVCYITSFWIVRSQNELFIFRLCGANRDNIITKVICVYSKNYLFSCMFVNLIMTKMVDIIDKVFVETVLYLLGMGVCMLLSLKYTNISIQKMRY